MNKEGMIKLLTFKGYEILSQSIPYDESGYNKLRQELEQCLEQFTNDNKIIYNKVYPTKLPRKKKKKMKKEQKFAITVEYAFPTHNITIPILYD